MLFPHTGQNDVKPFESSVFSDGRAKWNTAGNCTSAEIKYLVFNPTSKAGAVRAILDTAPQEYGGLTLKEVRFDQYGSGDEIELSAVYSAEESSIDYSTEGLKYPWNPLNGT